MTDLQTKLAYLDAALCGTPWWKVEQATHQLDNYEPKTFVYTPNQDDQDRFAVFGGVEYYLSDGGYSRVVLGVFDRKLFLTSNSRDEVKAKWESCKEQIAAVEAECEKMYAAALAAGR